MTIKTIYKTIKVLGDEWEIEISRRVDGDIKLSVYNKDDESDIVRSKSLVEAKVVAQNLIGLIEDIEETERDT